jgi:hypothetical protein
LQDVNKVDRREKVPPRVIRDEFDVFVRVGTVRARSGD